MTQTTFLEDDPVHRLMLFGYSEREASFLVLAGFHSGFFLRRQYNQFVGKRAGGADAALIEKLLAKGHATAVLGCRQTAVYHLSARPFYAALAPGDNRNRRMRPPAHIKARLMALDYVLDHPDHRYLATEQERTSYFLRTFGVLATELPGKTFRSPNGETSTTRFFVDKYPIFIRAEETGSAIGFCFVDEGLTTCSRFAGYLHQYGPLWGRLPGFQVIYIAASRNLLWQAENLFQRFIRGSHIAPLRAVDIDRLLAHFADRNLAERRQWDAFDKARLIRFRGEREEFGGSHFDSLYERWCTGGSSLVHASLASMAAPRPPLKGAFSTCLLTHNYDLFEESSEGADE